ncbi:MAG: hypothetical protein JKY48_06390 [Flavobacteriales bacterium]|nr:hypothetical protein [Flavobacteriales bacterium]
MIILLYKSDMLDHEQIQQIPKTTRVYWNDFAHQNCYGFDWAEKYIGQFDQIKEVYSNSFLFKSMVFMVQARQGFLNIIQEVQQSKNLIRKHAESMVSSVDFMRTRTDLKVKQICQYFGISKDWYYSQKRRIVCKLSTLKKCFKIHPNQLTIRESNTIEAAVFHPDNYGRTMASIYYECMRNSVIACALSTFYGYAKAHGYKKPKYPKLPRKVGLKATRIFEWLHVDITKVPTLNDGMQKVAFIKDNYSKAILNHASTDGKAGSEFIRNLLRDTFEKYGLYELTEDINILSDGGSENKGFLLDWIDRIQSPPIVRKITAQTDDFSFSNSMSESTHAIYKTEFLRKKISPNKLEHHKSLDRFVIYFNDERYPVDHFGYTPMEVLNGKTPDKYQFKEQIALARKERIKANQSFDGCYLII